MDKKTEWFARYRIATIFGLGPLPSFIFASFNFFVFLIRGTFFTKEECVKFRLEIYAPMQHCRKAMCGKVAREDFEFIGGGGGRYLLQVKESIMIKKLNPKLNDNITSVPLYLS